MKKISVLLLLALMVLSLDSCKSIRELKSLSKCQFRVASLKNIQLAGINIQSIRQFSDLSLGDAAKATAAFLSGNIPLAMTVNLEAKNPNSRLAALNRIEWIALIDDREMLNGIVTDRVEVQPNGGVANIPLNFSVNLKNILSQFTKSQLLDFGIGIADKDDRPTRLSVKLKPSLMVGRTAVAYPGWITVKRDFTSN